MKAKSVLMILLMTVIPILCSAQTKSEAGNAPTNPAGTTDSEVPEAGSENTSSAPESIGPQQILQQYEAVMAAIAQSFNANLAGITEAVQQGKMSSDEGKTSTTEQYFIAQMKFQLLNAWRQMDEEDLAKAPAPDDKSEDSRTGDNEIVLVELPFSSFELTAAVAEHLGLTQSQKEAIQQVMTRERHHIEPLMAQLQNVRGKLLAVDPRHWNDSEIRTLAKMQAALLARFIVANARMQSEIYKLLTPEQRRDLDDIKRSSESGTVDR